MSATVDWQQRVEEVLSKIDGYIFNPRRDDWDMNWE
jgi:hypothetical protein